MNKYLIDRFPIQEERSLFTLVENRTSYSFEMCELNLFETHESVENVNLIFDHFVLTSMLSGKKIMKLAEHESFEYLPGESVILPPRELMNIDFPEAKLGNPTQCIALTISDEVIQKTFDLLNEYYPKAPTWGQWDIDPTYFHLTNNKELADTINRIIRITKSEHGKAKDIMVELTLKEMLVRLMQTQARLLFEGSYHQLSNNNSLAAVVKYIKENLTSKIDLNKLSDKAYMSRASFYKKFREVMGNTPAQYILKERIKLAKEQLKSPSFNITEVCFACGFENLSHFIKSFKNEVGMTPKAYQLSFK
ncbi:AraC family transcriptional regulator [Fulvivirga sp. 29W222]|uniref:AraC family transcriptional regulator n=1 Tax=Fulvivirga marina TaxID=2494733 RepID=A0A937G1Q4_9BACT|nr:AraC family transcriptional regulator [Fulvivirga marina]MBL6448448.1 AraC family transcriptional regulator [Fulvivirga marina]